MTNRAIRIVAILLGLFAIVGLVVVFRENLATILGRIEGVARAAGPYAAVVAAVAYGLWGILLLPAAPMIGLVGTLFSSQILIGAAVISVGSAISHATGYLSTSFFLRERVRDRVGEKPWFQKLEAQTEERGAIAVLMYRIFMFLPQPPANYAFGLTRVPFVPYLTASFIGTLPSAFLYAGGVAGLLNLIR